MAFFFSCVQKQVFHLQNLFSSLCSNFVWLSPVVREKNIFVPRTNLSGRITVDRRRCPSPLQAPLQSSASPPPVEQRVLKPSRSSLPNYESMPQKRTHAHSGHNLKLAWCPESGPANWESLNKKTAQRSKVYIDISIMFELRA